MWTKEEIETLQRLWPDFTAKEIGEKLGRTRNSIIGKMNRLKKQGLIRPATYCNKKVTYNKPITRKKAALTAYGEPKKLIDIKNGECRWPIGSGKDMLFCAAKCEGTYCKKHYKVSVSKTQKRKTKKSNFVDWKSKRPHYT